MRNQSLRETNGLSVFTLAMVALVLAGQFLTGCGEETVGPPEDPDAQIVITSPTGGQSIKAGTTQPIRWKLKGKGLTEVTSVNIELSADSGKKWLGLLLTRSVGLNDSDWANYKWVVPDKLVRLGVTYDLAGKSNLLLRVSQYGSGDPDKIAVMAKTFSVTAP